MTSEGLGEMFEGEHVDLGPSGGSSVRRSRGEDPHWREQNFIALFSTTF
jgi:hypothetical protein